MPALLKRYEGALFALLLLTSFGLHVYRLAVPARPVFDEAYFTTFAADNVLGRVFFDVHPPLGKWIYALPLLFYPQIDLSGAHYVTFGHNATTDNIQTNYNPAPFGNFPYVPLRGVSVLFGLLLVAGFYLLVRTLAGPVAALLGTFCLIFENALLLDTRLVLMDGMYLAFGVWALYFFLKERSRPVIAGVLFGLALSVKLTAVVFAGIAFIALALQWNARPGSKRERRGWKFLAAAFLTLALCEFGLSAVVIRPNVSMNYDIGLFGWTALQHIAAGASSSWIAAAAKSTVVNGLLMLSGYTSGLPHPLESPWYAWPFMWKPMQLTNAITLVGNPFVWLASTAAVIGALFLLIKKAKDRIFNASLRPVLLLFTGYFFCLLPFFTIVHRSTFLYHYFPALLFALALLGLFAARALEALKGRYQAIFLGSLAVLTIVGFLVAAPYTYGL